MTKAEKERLARVGKTFNAKKYIKEEIDAINLEIEAAQRNYEYEKAAKLRYSSLPDLEKRLEEAKQKIITVSVGGNADNA